MVIAAIVSGAALLDGCASLDPSADIEQASTLVAGRSEIETGWTSPWFEVAQQWDGASALSAGAAVRVALQNNREIRRQVETIVASRADFVQAHLLPNPVINVAFGFPTDGLGGDPFTVALVQQLAWLWTRPHAIDAAEAELRARVLAVSDDALRLVAQVRTEHARVLFAERAVTLHEENIVLLKRLNGLLDERFTVGEASRLDINRVELDLEAAQIALVDRRTNLEQAKRRLLAMLGRADASTDWTTDDIAPGSKLLHGELGEWHVMQLASLQRLDIAAANAVVQARQADVGLQETGRMPDLSAGVGYQQNFSSRPGVFPSGAVTPKLFDDNSARIARAESELRQAQIEADRVRQAAIAEARSSWVGLRAQQEVVESYQNTILALAEQNLSLARDAFDVGETDLTVLIDAQQQRNDAGIQLSDRQHAAAVLLIDLERAAGGSLELQPPVHSALASTLEDEKLEETPEVAR